MGWDLLFFNLLIVLMNQPMNLVKSYDIAICQERFAGGDCCAGGGCFAGGECSAGGDWFTSRDCFAGGGCEYQRNSRQRCDGKG